MKFQQGIKYFPEGKRQPKGMGRQPIISPFFLTKIAKKLHVFKLYYVDWLL